MNATTLAPGPRRRGERVIGGPATSVPHARRHSAARTGFTLIELLVVMLVIAILTSMVMAGLYAAGESAKIGRTRGTITKINNALVQRWESYRTRRIAVARNPSDTADQFARDRLVAIWDMMRMEMPDNYADLNLNSYPLTPQRPDPRQNANWIAYRRFLQTIPAPNGPIDPDNPGIAAAQHASAECLYIMLVVSMNAEEEVNLSASEVGDTDNDGVPEVLDGWGRPIHWIRWAPGFVSPVADTDLHPNPNTDFQPDPFDPLGVGRPPKNVIAPTPSSTPYGFKLAPLVYSAGPDGEYGIHSEFDPAAAGNPYSHHNGRARGTPVAGIEGGGHGDNITSHRLGTR